MSIKSPFPGLDPYLQRHGGDVHQPLRPLPIPLRHGEKPILLDVQAFHDECFRKGRYDRLNYAAPLEPPLSADDDAWAKQFLAAVGKL
jgi:Protein of unknown function (DUF4058)